MTDLRPDPPAADSPADLSADRVLAPPAELAMFNQAGLLLPADIHVARRLMALAGESGGPAAPLVSLAAALAVRAPRVSHVAIDLASARTAAPGVEDDIDLDSLPWPEPGPWLEAVRSSSLVGLGDAPGPPHPLVLDGGYLYLHRYWQDEVLVARSILERLEPLAGPTGDVEERLARLFPGDGSADQLAAARVALSHQFCVVAGGPGTGKTTTVARILAAMAEPVRAAGGRWPIVALAAPTGKAAARMEEAVHFEAARMDTPAEVAGWLAGLAGSTLHRLLGWRFDRPGRFRHHAGHRLPHDVVVVDEASMVSLANMARLIEALAPTAVLILVGDPEQLVSVEAGAVLADIVGPAGSAASAPAASAAPAPIAPTIAVLRRNHRFSGGRAELAAAIRAGDAERAMSVLTAGDPSVRWVPADDPEELLAHSPRAELAEVRDRITRWGRDVAGAAADGDAGRAIGLLRAERLLCAHRRGPAGVAIFNPAVERWVSSADSADAWYPGRPVLVTANDYTTGLYNGDGGVVITAPAGTARVVVAIDEGPGRAPRLVSPTRLGAVETVFAMTVHKSQGSEFDRVTLVLPPAGSRLLTRELVYTAVTRARSAVCVVGSEGALADAIRTPVARASGLGRRLWPDILSG